MLSVPQLDPMPSLLAWAKADGHIAALVSDRVRGYEPKGATDTYEGDALGSGHYKAFIVISALSVPLHPRVPVTFAEYTVRCYGVTAQHAWSVWAAFVKAFHMPGERVESNGLGIYQTFILTGGSQDKDPDTDQPVTTGSLRVTATTVAVPGS
jgi:hypothetical protein